MKIKRPVVVKHTPASKARKTERTERSIDIKEMRGASYNMRTPKVERRMIRSPERTRRYQRQPGVKLAWDIIGLASYVKTQVIPDIESIVTMTGPENAATAMVMRSRFPQLKNLSPIFL